MMNTIEEIESLPASPPEIGLLLDGEPIKMADIDIQKEEFEDFGSSKRDSKINCSSSNDILNDELQSGNHLDPNPHKPLEQYISYRGLSRSGSNKALNRKSGSLSSLSKSLKELNRKSFCEAPQPHPPQKSKIRPTKSCEHISNKVKRNNSEIPETNVTDLMSYRMRTSRERLIEAEQDKENAIVNGKCPKSQLKCPSQVSKSSHLSHCPSKASELTVDTLKKSDASTMTDMDDRTTVLAASPYSKHRRGSRPQPLDPPLHNPPKDIMQWLHDCDDIGIDPGAEDSESSSDYSSTYYKTSQSSSKSDLTSPTRSTVSSDKSSKKRRKKEKDILGNLRSIFIRSLFSGPFLQF